MQVYHKLILQSHTVLVSMQDTVKIKSSTNAQHMCMGVTVVSLFVCIYMLVKRYKLQNK